MWGFSEEVGTSGGSLSSVHRDSYPNLSQEGDTLDITLEHSP